MEALASRFHHHHRYRAGSSVPFSGGLLTLGYYYTTVAVGTPAKNFTVLLDTGSSNLLLPTPKCGTSCGNRTLYDHTTSSSANVIPFADPACKICNSDGSTTNCPYGNPYPAVVNASYCGTGISYGGGSSFVSGYLVSEQVSLWGYSQVPNIIVAVTMEIPDLSFSAAPLDGLIGLASELNSVNPTYAPTILTELTTANKLPNLFSICLDPVNGGSLDIGTIDPSKYTGTIQYLPVVQDHWYNLPLQDLQIAGTSIGLPAMVYSYLNDQIGTFPDSGTSVLVMGPAIFAQFQATFQASFCALPGVCGNSNLFNGLCVSDADMGASLSKFPQLEFVFADAQGKLVTLPVPATAYMMHQNGQYCLGAAAVPSTGVVLGDVFMQNYYIVHDRANKQVGFAPVAKCV
eukprot:gnl/Hemi2/680_TR243_c0_g2_i1.p1 gnl/Hemi2/680_TR243_c0_g2~~gnl/Hemi2/680_TR243_c0_g2_i1.p1  ORF type:complete len:463 (-),score=83.29 gnl/Hemi2/680_TR243_c0_g2_i1:61-1269(-)